MSSAGAPSSAAPAFPSTAAAAAAAGPSSAAPASTAAAAAGGGAWAGTVFVKRSGDARARFVPVEIFAGAKRVAAHARSSEPGAIVRDPAHFVGIWRTPAEIPAGEPPPGQLAAMGRSLSDYTAVIEEAA